VGDGTDADIFGDGIDIAVDTQFGPGDANDGSLLPRVYTAATNVVVTAIGGAASFSAGVVRLTIYYFLMNKPTS
jgi:hypothetical protein